MPRPRQYANDAERQAAYRDRNADQQPPRASLLAALGRSLHAVVRDAASAGDERAKAILGATADETLKRLIDDFKAKAD